MSVLLGKRKRQPRSSNPRDDTADLDENVHAIFAKHFNAHFAPLKTPVNLQADRRQEQEARDELDDASDWSGISSDPEAVEVVVATRPMKKPRSLIGRPPSRHTTDEEDPDEKLNIKKDLDLQRLLRESHLLESEGETKHSGSRQKVMDLRLQSLGSKQSLLEHNHMPMSHRRGIMTKLAEKKALRRKEAKENGIILEKVELQNSVEARRLRSVDMPSVGKWRGGTLSLSRHDVVSISGPHRPSRRKR